jgi:phosphopantetheinyl transferase
VADNLPDISFSVSHVDEIAIVAVSSTLQVGIDVETIDQELNNSVVEGFCHSNENSALSELPTTQKTREFLRLWTQKEAYTKLLGLGHSMDFKSIDHSSGQVETFGSLRVSQTHFEGFYIPLDQSLYYASLAVQSANASWIELQRFDVIGPDATTGPLHSPSAPLSVPVAP